MTVIINPSELAILEAVQTDGSAINTSGISIDTNGDGTGDVPYCTDLPVPIKNYQQIVPPGSSIAKTVADGYRISAAPLLRYVKPFAFSYIGSGPEVLFTASTSIASISISASDRPHVTRNAQAQASFTVASSATETTIEYWIEVDGVASGKMRYAFSAANDRRNLSGTWILSIPVNAQSIVLKATRYSGLGTLVSESAETVALTVMG